MPCTCLALYFSFDTDMMYSSNKQPCRKGEKNSRNHITIKKIVFSKLACYFDRKIGRRHGTPNINLTFPEAIRLYQELRLYGSKKEIVWAPILN